MSSPCRTASCALGTKEATERILRSDAEQGKKEMRTQPLARVIRQARVCWSLPWENPPLRDSRHRRVPDPRSRGRASHNRTASKLSNKLSNPNATYSSRFLIFTIQPHNRMSLISASASRRLRQAASPSSWLSVRRFSASSCRLVKVEEHDIVIVGGGPAGLVLASALGKGCSER